eukprot:COSAG01_NODE_477_length_16509_cov_38.684217_10_plen_97_part_00
MKWRKAVLVPCVLECAGFQEHGDRVHISREGCPVQRCLAVSVDGGDSTRCAKQCVDDVVAAATARCKAHRTSKIVHIASGARGSAQDRRTAAQDRT